MGQLHTPAPQLECQQTHKPAPTFLIKGHYDTIDSLMFPSHSTIRMFLTISAYAMMNYAAV